MNSIVILNGDGIPSNTIDSVAVASGGFVAVDVVVDVELSLLVTSVGVEVDAIATAGEQPIRMDAVRTRKRNSAEFVFISNSFNCG